MRPASIVNFERLYLAAIVLSLLTTYLVWNETLVLVQAQPGAQLGETFLVGVTIAGLLIQLVLWYFIAREGSSVAKWIFIVLLGLGAISLIINFASGAVITQIPVLLGLLSFALRAVAAWLLFRPDAAIWFGEEAPSADVS
jgi:hypothetical protein